MVGRRKKEILVFDEATNALDLETENEIMREIYNLQDNMTIIIVAHNLSTIKSCDVVYKLEDGNLSKINHNNI